MTTWDNADCLRRFKRAVGLADANEESDAVDLYPILSSAQAEVIREIGVRYPACLYSTQGPTALTAAADRKTFTFGTDVNGNAIMPLGWVQISPRLTAFSGDDAYLWREGVDFLDEGTRIRIPSARAYSGTLYGRWVPTPPDITAIVQPVLEPAEARDLIVNRAAKAWASEGNIRPDLVALMELEWGGPHNGRPPAKFATWMLTYRRRFRGGGALRDPALWYLYAPDLTGP